MTTLSSAKIGLRCKPQEQALASHKGCISYQVIQEFAFVATRKFARRFSADECQQFIDAAMQPLNRVASSDELTRAALALQADTSYSFYDCLILASALQVGATTLYSEDLQHNQLVGGTLRIVNPFLNVAMQSKTPVWPTPECDARVCWIVGAIQTDVGFCGHQNLTPNIGAAL